MQRKEYEIAYFMNFLYLLQFRKDYKSLWFAENTAFSGFLSIGYSSNSSIIMCKINGFLKALQLFPWRREGMNNVIIWHDTQTAVNGFWHEESWQFFLLKYAAEHCWFFVPDTLKSSISEATYEVVRLSDYVVGDLRKKV